MEGELETGFKWWVRYVIVPLLGGGTIVTLIIALAKPGNNTQSPPDARQQTAKKQYIPPKEDPKLISTDHPDPKFPVDNRVTSLNYQVKSGESKINGGAEILAPNGSRPARAGELCSI